MQGRSIKGDRGAIFLNIKKFLGKMAARRKFYIVDEMFGHREVEINCTKIKVPESRCRSKRDLYFSRHHPKYPRSGGFGHSFPQTPQP